MYFRLPLLVPALAAIPALAVPADDFLPLDLSAVYNEDAFATREAPGSGHFTLTAPASRRKSSRPSPTRTASTGGRGLTGAR